MADYTSPATNLGRDPYAAMRPSVAPKAISGKAQPRSPHGPKIAKPRKVTVKSHVRTVKPKAPAAAPGLDTATKNLLDAAVRLKFGGAEQGYNQQLQANARFQSGVPAWYAQAMNEIKGIGATSAAQNAQTLQNVQAYNSPVAQTGTPDAVQAAAARNSLNSQYGTMLGRDSQANQDFLSRLQGGMVVQQGNTLNAANRDAQTIRQNQTALQGQKGDFRATTLAGMQADRAKQDVENKKIQASLLIADGKLDLAKKVLSTVTQPNATNQRKVARTNARTNSKSQKETAAQHKVDNAIKVNRLALDAYTKAHPELKTKGGGKGKAAFTPTQTRKAASTFRTLGASLDENAVHKDPNGAINALVKGKKTDPVVANAIVESILNHGSVSRDTATLYYRATGHHLHVGAGAKKVAPSVGKLISGVLNKLG